MTDLQSRYEKDGARCAKWLCRSQGLQDSFRQPGAQFGELRQEIWSSCQNDDC